MASLQPGEQIDGWEDGSGSKATTSTSHVERRDCFSSGSAACFEAKFACFTAARYKAKFAFSPLHPALKYCLI